MEHDFHANAISTLLRIYNHDGNSFLQKKLINQLTSPTDEIDTPHVS
jgi:hypothetical protein